MNISPTTGGSSATSSSTTAGGGLGTLGQTDFLRLMTVQMQQQDPFDPVDQKEMLAQMAQFSSLAGIGEINQNLRSITEMLDAVLTQQDVDGAGTAPAAEASANPEAGSADPAATTTKTQE